MSNGSVNKVILIGNVGNDPEIRFLPDSTCAANLSIATSEKWKDKKSGQAVEKTEWHRCHAFGKLAEIIQQYVKKGSKIYIDGSIHTRKWQDQDGSDRYSTEVKIRSMQMLDSRNQNGDSLNSQAQAGPHASPEGFDNFDDDIPF